jgi:hypothetical protein
MSSRFLLSLIIFSFLKTMPLRKCEARGGFRTIQPLRSQVNFTDKYGPRIIYTRMNQEKDPGGCRGRFLAQNSIPPSDFPSVFIVTLPLYIFFDPFFNYSVRYPPRCARGPLASTYPNPVTKHFYSTFQHICMQPQGPVCILKKGLNTPPTPSQQSVMDFSRDVAFFHTILRR